MKIYVGVTDHNWFQYLAAEKPDELNFREAGGIACPEVAGYNDRILTKEKGYFRGVGYLLEQAAPEISFITRHGHALWFSRNSQQ